MRTRERGDRGAVMVEFALILPILAMLLLGIIEFGRAFNTTISMQAAAREGARELALRRDADVVDAAVVAASPSVDHSTLAITQAPCPDDPGEDGQAQVTLQQPFTFNVPLFPGTLGSITLSAKGVMRCGL